MGEEREGEGLMHGAGGVRGSEEAEEGFAGCGRRRWGVIEGFSKESEVVRGDARDTHR